MNELTRHKFIQWAHSYMCVPSRIHICDVAYSNPWHDLFIYATWRIEWLVDSLNAYEWAQHNSRVMSHIWIRYTTHMNASCRTHMRVSSWNERVTSSLIEYIQVSSLQVMGHVTHMNTSCHTYEWAMSHTYVSELIKWTIRHVSHMNQWRLCWSNAYKWGEYETWAMLHT